MLRYEGKSAAGSGSPREILKAAYEVYDFIDEDIWLDMLKARNDMTHIYDGNAAENTCQQHFAQIYSGIYKIT